MKTKTEHAGTKAAYERRKRCQEETRAFLNGQGKTLSRCQECRAGQQAYCVYKEYNENGAA